MSDFELEEFNQLVAAIYSGPYEDKPWQTFLQQLREICNAKMSVLSLSRPRPNYPGVTFLDGMDSSQESNLQYANEFGALDPFVNLPDGVAVTIEEVVPLDQLRKTAFYQKFMLPTDCVQFLGIDILHDGVVRILLRVARGEMAPAFTETERQLFNLLVPHLRQLLQWLDRDQRQESERALYETVTSRLAMGTILLDQSRHILHCNPTARHMLSSREGLREINGRLVADSPSDNHLLQQLLKQSCERQDFSPGLTEAITLSRSHSPSALYLLIKPVAPSICANDHADPIELGDEANPPRTALYINAPDKLDITHQAILQQLFDFTPSEARLAIALANGLSLDEIAAELCVTRNTLRSHLRSTFQKTDVNQQSALVSLVLRSIAGLG